MIVAKHGYTADINSRYYRTVYLCHRVNKTGDREEFLLYSVLTYTNSNPLPDVNLSSKAYFNEYLSFSHNIYVT